MKLIYCWLVTLRILFRYFLYRIGIGTRPNFTDRWPEVQRVYRQITRMDSRIRLRGLEHYPGGHPAVYAGNHIKLDDPFFVCYAAQEASDYSKRIRFVMRDNFFGGFPWKFLPLDMNEVAEMGGSYNISQGSPSLAQLKPLIDILLEPDSFVIFPGGGRSRSGLWFEYRGGLEGPGSIAFFLAQAQRKNPDVPVPAVPVGRTHNPVTGVSTVMLGEALQLPPGARRDAQRLFDDELVVAISDLVEVNMLHLLGGLVYLRCLHGLQVEVSRVSMEDAIRKVVAGMDAGRFYDPALDHDLQGTMNRTLRYFQKHGMLQVTGDCIRCERGTVLASPPLDVTYRDTNPVMYSVNQILHLPDVVNALEATTLG
jgi:1-acyl-sn-glycerol-3-phosphate acyltransferase